MSFVSPFSLTGWVQRKSNAHLPLLLTMLRSMKLLGRVPSSASMKDYLRFLNAQFIKGQAQFAQFFLSKGSDRGS